MKRLPSDAGEAVEGLLDDYARGKYEEPRWPKLSAEQHVAAAIRHLCGFQRELADGESGRSHLLHAHARTAFAASQELRDGRRPPDPLAGAIALLDEARKQLAAVEGAGWTPFQSIAREVGDLSIRLRRLHFAQRAAQDGGIAWLCHGETGSISR